MIVNVGVDYHNMPIEDREIFSLNTENISQIYREVNFLFPEIVFLSTCNRLETYFYSSTGSPSKMINWLIDKFIPPHTNLEKAKELKSKFYHYRDSGAARHLFEVAAGLHSMVIGENQILHQIKNAYQDAKAHLSLSPEFNKLFQTALGVGKKVRSQTDIGKGGMSLGSVSVDIIKKFYEKNSQFTVLLIGAGEIAEEVLKSLTHHGQVRVQVCNRNPERAKNLLSRYQDYFTAEYIPFDERYRAVAEANVIVASTNAPHHVITYLELKKSLDGHFRFSFFIDLSVPRNIDPAISNLQDVILYTLDDLDKIISENYSQRSSQINLCHNLIEEQLQDFIDWENKRRFFIVKQEWERILEDVNKEREKNRQEPIPLEKLDALFEQQSQNLVNWNLEELTKDHLTQTLEAFQVSKTSK